MSGVLKKFGPLMLRVTLLIPLLLSAISGILVSVTLSSGSSPGNLEDLAIFKLNLSKINVARGLQADNTTTPLKRDVIVKRQMDIFDNLLNAAASGQATPPGGITPPVGVAPPGSIIPPGSVTPPGGTAPPGGITPPSGIAPPSGIVPPGSTASTPGMADLLGGATDGALRGAIGQALSAGSVQGVIQPFIQSVSQGVQAGLGVPQWVSLHARTICNGDFTNINDPNAGVNVRSCTQPGKRPSSLGEIIGLNGPLITLTSSLALPKAVNESTKLLLDGVNILAIALTVLFVFAAIFSFFAVLANFVALILPTNNIVVALNAALTTIAAALVTGIFVGTSIVVTIIVNSLNKILEDFEIVAQLGTPFLGIGIGATLLSLGAAGIWSIVFVIQFRQTLVQLFKVAFTKSKKRSDPAEPPEKSYMF